MKLKSHLHDGIKQSKIHTGVLLTSRRICVKACPRKGGEQNKEIQKKNFENRVFIRQYINSYVRPHSSSGTQVPSL